MATVQLNPNDIRDYVRFLRIKGLPQYRITGRSAWFPDEYADRIDGCDVSLRYANFEPSSFAFDYQRAITKIAVEKKRFCVFARCGLGKTIILLDFALAASMATKRRVLIVSPLMVVGQTIEEAKRFYGESLPLRQIRANELQSWLNDGDGIAITNYEAITEDLVAANLGGLILDESSMLKSHYGAWGTRLLAMGRGVEYKLCLSGTPAPNDRIEYANHAVFMDAFPTVNSFLARFFVNRGQTRERWELKAHALEPFYRALSHWCIFLNDPATYGWKDNCDTIPPIVVTIHDVPSTRQQRDALMDSTGTLFVGEAGGIGSRGKIARIGKGFHGGEKIESNKTKYVADLVASWPDESTIVWCKYNAEQDEISKAIPGCGNIDGSTPLDERKAIIDWFQGKICTCEMRKRTRRTCESITHPTSTNGSHAQGSSETHITLCDEKDTRPANQSESKPESSRATGRRKIQSSGNPKDSENTVSRSSNTIRCSNCSTEDVPSANHLSAGANTQDTSTTATRPESSGASCVPNAILDLESSKMTPLVLSVPRCTCGGIPLRRVLVSKPRILGLGLNLQSATRQVFSSLQDSYEEYHQAVHRSNRIGSTRPLNVHIPVTEFERPMIETVLKKAKMIDRDTETQERLFREKGLIHV